MPHRAFTMTYAVDIGDDRPLVGPFADNTVAQHWAETYCADYPDRACTVRAVMPALFACASTLDDEKRSG